MRYWFDTEFIEDGRTIDLISIGIVAEDEHTYYAQNFDCDHERATSWVRDNVLTQLLVPEFKRKGSPFLDASGTWRYARDIADDIKRFCDPGQHGKPEFWGYYADYDWVVLCQLFGTMMDLPKGWPMYCRDLKQWCDQLGNPRLPEQGKGEHHALADARWNRQAWEFLVTHSGVAA